MSLTFCLIRTKIVNYLSFLLVQQTRTVTLKNFNAKLGDDSITILPCSVEETQVKCIFSDMFGAYKE